MASVAQTPRRRHRGLIIDLWICRSQAREGGKALFARHLRIRPLLVPLQQSQRILKSDVVTQLPLSVFVCKPDVLSLYREVANMKLKTVVCLELRVLSSVAFVKSLPGCRNRDAAKVINDDVAMMAAA